MGLMVAMLASAVLTLEPREYTAAELRGLVGGRSDLLVRSADRERPAVVTGGRKVSGWTIGTDGVWRVALPDARAGRWDFSQLFVNGARRYRPRVPARGWYEALEPTRVEKDRGRADFGVGGFLYGGDVLDQQWANRADLEVQMLFRWNGARMRIRELDAERREVVLSSPHPGVLPQHSPRGARFAVENVKEAFGCPGEWYFDRTTGDLSYAPLPGETPMDCTVEAPHDEVLLELANVRRVTFRNVVFRLNNANTPHGRSEFTAQGEIGSGAAVRVRASSGIAFEGCRFQNLGNWALSFDGDCSDCRVSACVMADLGSGGVLLGSTEKAAVRVTVEDTEIVSYGRRHPGAPGIMAVQGAGCRFLHNHIHDGYYTGISVGWGWRAEANPLSRHNEIGHNHIHDIGQRQLSDMGLVYLLSRQPGTRVHHNDLHDVSHWHYGSAGIYPDECSAHLEIDHNLVRNAGRSLHCNMVRDLDVHDNVFADGSQIQWDFSSNVGEEGPYLRLHRNTFVWSGGLLARRGISFKATPEERKAFSTPFWQGLDLRGNVYFDRTGNRRVFPSADIRAEDPPRLTLEEFQAASGQERGSAFRDPGSLDPMRVCGRTGVRQGARVAAWPMPGSPAPFGLEEQYVLRRANREVEMNDGIATSLAKLRRGGAFTVAYFGGSITAGTSYRPPFTAWLQAAYPQARVREINAGLGGTGSNLGVYRLARDVLRHDPDLIFVEFALNDSDRSSVDPTRIGADVESIVRQIWSHDPTTDIVFLYTVSRKLAETFRRGVQTREAAIYSTVAERYRIPTVNFSRRVLELERAGRLVWTLGQAPTAVPKEDPEYERKVGAEMAAKGMLVFSGDGVHPRAEGGRLYVEALADFFGREMPNPYAWNRPNLIAASPFAPDPCVSPVSLELSEAWLKGTWRPVAADDGKLGLLLSRTDSMWVTDAPGDSLSLELDGAEAALLAAYGPSGGRLDVWVDGRRLPSRDLCDRYCTYWRLMRVPLFRGARGRHRVEVRVSPDQPDREPVRAYNALSDERARQIGLDGCRVAIGRVLLDGQVSGPCAERPSAWRPASGSSTSARTPPGKSRGPRRRGSKRTF